MQIAERLLVENWDLVKAMYRIICTSNKNSAQQCKSVQFSFVCNWILTLDCLLYLRLGDEYIQDDILLPSQYKQR